MIRLPNHRAPLARTVLLAALLGAVHPARGASGAVGLPLHSLPDSGARAASVCAGLPIPCDAAATQAFSPPPHAGGPARDAIVLIDASRPMLVIAGPGRDGPKRQWDFSGYQHSSPPIADAGDAEPLAIHPALYRLDDSHLAVALVSHFTESYSGGGAGFEMADFLRLDEGKGAAPSAGTYEVAYAGIPFSCNTMVRACFTEREYQTSPHCHQESDGHLTLRFAEAPSQWSFTWHQTDWPAHKPARSKKPSQVTFGGSPAARPYTLPGKVSFCGARPQAWPEAEAR